MPEPLTASILVAVVVAAVIFLTGRREPLHADEGYLWYGVLRTLEGEVPVRDLRSYEPGRYYWCAAICRLLGTGLFSIRAGTHLFYAVGLTAGLWSVSRSGAGWLTLAVCGVVLGLWARPGHKLFEPALTMIAIATGTWLIVDPAAVSVLAAGLVAGLAWFWGVNYGAYLTLGLGAMLALVSLRAAVPPTSVGYFVVGLAIGALPILTMIVAVRGFGSALLQHRVRRVIARGTTNLPRAFPWPWRRLGYLNTGPGRVLRWYFLLVPMFLWATALWSLFADWERVQSNPTLAAAGLVGAVTIHHVVSRADVSHLCQVVPPLVIGVLAAAHTDLQTVVSVAVLLPGTVAITMREHHLPERMRYPNRFVRADVADDWIWLRPRPADLLAAVRREVADKGASSLLAVPNLAWLYPTLGLHSPVYDTFCVYPASRDEEREMISQIDSAEVDLVVVRDSPLDGREDLRYSRTHPEVWSYIQTNFQRLDTHLPPQVSLWHRAAGRGSSL